MSWIDEFPERIAALDAAHQRRRRREVVPAAGASLLVDGQPLLAFCSNDYLGLAGHPALVQAAAAGAREFGLGSGGSPLVSGHSAANARLERELAAFVQLPRALYFYAGYATNVGIVPALVGDGDALFSDALNHACLIDGARLSRARVHRYPHADLAALERELAASPARRKLVISDASSAWMATSPTSRRCWRCASGTTPCCCWTTPTASACWGRRAAAAWRSTP